jgi:transcriptional regulator
MTRPELDLLQGTLDLLVLNALSTGPMHGYSILAWLREAAGDALRVEDAALYPALHRMEARGLVASEWGVSENNRRAKFYTLTAKGRKAVKTEAATWRRYAGIVARVLDTAKSRS